MAANDIKKMMIRSYHSSDFLTVLQLLESNIPKYFALEELVDFKNYLEEKREDYFVVEIDKIVVGAGGINYFENETARISWDFIHPNHHGKGIGKALLQYRLLHIKSTTNIRNIVVRTSQLAFKFYEKQGFQLKQIEKDFWAKGLHLYYMTLEL